MHNHAFALAVARRIVVLFIAVFFLHACQSIPDPSADEVATVDASGMLNVQGIADMDDEELEQAIVEITESKMNDSENSGYQALSELPRGYQVVYSTWRLESEVNSGGFTQYFGDTDAKFSFLAIESFVEIGAPKTANLIKRAMLNAESAARDMGELDNEFFDGTENLSQLRVEYARNHPNLFVANKK